MNYNTIIKTGKNTGKVCDRKFCKIKGHNGYNLSESMNFPDYFINVYNQNKKYFDDLGYVYIYKKHLILNKNRLSCIEDIKTMLLCVENADNKDKKAFISILLFKLLDTPNINWFINENNEMFKTVVYLKITYFTTEESYIPMREYCKNNLELNKKYLHIELNKLHRKKILRKYIRSTMIFYGLYRIVIEKRYRPGGVGYYECEERFYKNCKEFEKLKNI